MTNAVFTASINRDQVPAVIANGASLSAAVDVGIDTVVAIAMPAAWTGASLTFQVKAEDDADFQDLYDEAGNEVEIPAAASRHISLGGSLIYFAGAKQIKVRSGTSAIPVNQSAERTLQLITKPLSA